MAPIPTLKLNDGNAIPFVSSHFPISQLFHIPKLHLHNPQLGFGTGTANSRRRQEEPGFNHALVSIIKSAIAQGIRHIDGATNYGNEEEIGVAIKESGVPREELFITTKVRDIATLPGAIEESLKKLGLEYVDL